MNFLQRRVFDLKGLRDKDIFCDKYSRRYHEQAENGKSLPTIRRSVMLFLKRS